MEKSLHAMGALRLAALLATVSSSAFAQAPSIGAPVFGPGRDMLPSTPVEEDEDESGVARHQGLYVRLALGVGYMHAWGSAETELVTADVTKAGLAELSEISMGGTLAPGLVLGGGIYGSTVIVTNTTIRARDRDTDTVDEYELEENLSAMSMLCPFVDYYFNPSGGVHALAAPCYTLIDLGGTSEYYGGPGFNLGLGWDGYVGRSWSLGAMARLGYTYVRKEDSRYFALVPGLLFTATYH